MRYALTDIVSAFPKTIDQAAIIARVNAACGLLPDSIPSPHVTYGWSEIYQALRDAGYEGDGKGVWSR